MEGPGENRRSGEHLIVESIHLSHHVSKTFVENVLRRFYSEDGICPFVKITNFSCTELDLPFKSGKSNIIAVTADATIKTERRTHHIVVKTLPLESCQRVIASSGIYDKREINFYTEIRDDLTLFQQQELRVEIDHISLPVMKCLFAKYIPLDRGESRYPNISMEESVLVLENVRVQGFVNGSYTEGLTEEQVKSAFEAVSRLHALTLAMKMRSDISLNEQYEYLFNIREESEEYVRQFERNLPKVLQILDSVGGMASVIRKILRLRTDLKLLFEGLALPDGSMSVITHNNFWANNVMFRGSECLIIDWQMIACGRPTTDLALLMATSVRTGLRRRRLTSLLDHYYDHFSAHAQTLGVDLVQDLGYSRERFMSEYRRSQLLAFLTCVRKLELFYQQWDIRFRLLDYVTELNDENLLNNRLIRLPRMNF